MSDETYHLALSNEAQIEILQDEIKLLIERIEKLEREIHNQDVKNEAR